MNLRTAWPLLLAVCSWPAPCAAQSSTATAPTTDGPSTVDPRIVRGITLSTHGIGRDWGTDIIEPTMADIAATGANWVAIHPYAGIRDDGTVRFRPIDPDDPPASLVRPIRAAHAAGLSIMVKPHLAYWGSGFDWRGDIEFGDDAAAWQRFWTGYRAWITAIATVCGDADAFVVGTELDKTLQHDATWREIIAEIREVTEAPLTYAANWTDYQRVTFWDALDVIGVQAYFPIATARTTDPRQLERGWAARLDELHAFADRNHRRIVFTELGYNRSLDAPTRPWDARMDRDSTATELQTRCLDIALRAVESSRTIVGSFLWKWFPGDNPRDHDFKLQVPEVVGVLREVWTPPPATDADGEGAEPPAPSTPQRRHD